MEPNPQDPVATLVSAGRLGGLAGALSGRARRTHRGGGDPWKPRKETEYSRLKNVGIPRGVRGGSGSLPLAMGGVGGTPPIAAHSLPPSVWANFQNVRKAVLDRTGYSPEEQRPQFRELALAAGDRPFAYAQQLTDLARRWLQPEICSAAGVVEQVVLERFLGGLPMAMAAWVRCHHPSRL